MLYEAYQIGLIGPLGSYYQSYGIMSLQDQNIKSIFKAAGSKGQMKPPPTFDKVFPEIDELLNGKPKEEKSVGARMFAGLGDAHKMPPELIARIKQ